VIKRNPVIDAEQEILELERLLIDARERLRHEKRRRGIEQSWLDWVWESLGY
jgi:hypothetical protein